MDKVAGYVVFCSGADGVKHEKIGQPPGRLSC